MEIKYEDIQKANETIRTLTIARTDKKTGKEISKEYAEVNQRIKAFRMVYPTGIIETEMLSNENGVCVFRAIVGYRDGEEIYKLATGTAQEKENSTFINQTSYIENCETSAIGRALGMAGFGIDTSVASAEEVTNAINNQEKMATPEQITTLTNLDRPLKDKLVDHYKKDLTQFTELEAIQSIESLKKKGLLK